MLTVLFFASLRERLGCAQLTLDVAQRASVEQILERLCCERPQWRETLREAPLLAAVNQHMVKLDHPVGPGDELALFPPVTGG